MVCKTKRKQVGKGQDKLACNKFELVVGRQEHKQGRKLEPVRRKPEHTLGLVHIPELARKPELVRKRVPERHKREHKRVVVQDSKRVVVHKQDGKPVAGTLVGNKSVQVVDMLACSKSEQVGSNCFSYRTNG